MLLFVSKCTRPNMQLCVPFLCTQVKSPTIQDYKKIERVIGYLKNTVQLPLAVGIDSDKILTWYIQASFAVHLDFNSHIGTCTTLVHGSMLSLSSKQKSNEKGSLKTRLIRVDNKTTLDMLMKNFYIIVQYFYITN